MPTALPQVAAKLPPNAHPAARQAARSIHINDVPLVSQAFRLASRAVVEDIESECVAVQLGTHTWWDTRPMLDQREHSPQVIDMATEALAFALEAFIAERHRTEPHLVRIVGPF